LRVVARFPRSREGGGDAVEVDRKEHHPEAALESGADVKSAAFRWTAMDVPKPEVAQANAPTVVPSALSSSHRMAESVAAAIHRGIHTGRLIGGERVTESYLMHATHASRSQVRETLRSLAVDGLVDLQRGRGAIVPTPTVEDVLETYAVRRALGSLIVRSAAGWRPGTLAPLVAAFEDLKTVAQDGDTWTTGQADLDFQDVLAATANLRRVPAMFRRMTIQTRLFTSVLGLDYGYPIDRIIVDNAALLDAVRRRDAATAQHIWEQKMDDAASFMSRYLKTSTAAARRRSDDG
jgi:DNA-binding GntR family transcriptional regulator